MEKIQKMRAPVFNLDITLKSGQVFGWKKEGEWWIGEMDGSLIKIRQKNEWLEYNVLFSRESDKEKIKEGVKKYFSLDIPPEKMKKIYRMIAKDSIMKRAVKKYYGLRLIKQEPWYCTASFVCSSFSNIPRIEKIIKNIRERHGIAIDKEKGLYLFPSIDRLKKATPNDLRECGLGFRDRYLHQIANRTNKEWFDEIYKLNYHEAKKRLIQLPGIGDKVADCILLFGYGKSEAFPIDVWIRRIMLKFYGDEIRSFIEKKRSEDKTIKYRTGNKVKENKITNKDILEFAVSKWKSNAGLAQQFLYMYARENKL